MRQITRSLGIAALVCVALPIVADVATQLLPLMATLFICALLFTVLTGAK
jgi:hypothetical protein